MAEWKDFGFGEGPPKKPQFPTFPKSDNLGHIDDLYYFDSLQTYCWVQLPTFPK